MYEERALLVPAGLRVVACLRSSAVFGLIVFLAAWPARQANAQSWTNHQLMDVGLQRHVAAAGRDINGTDRVFVFAGGSETTTYSRNDAYDPISDTWDATSFAPLPTSRANPTETVGDDCRIYVIGGFEFGLQNQILYDIVEAYDPGTDTWDTNILPLNVPRAAAAAATGANGKIYVFGGHDPNTSGSFNSVEAYDPTQPNLGWVLQTPMPAGRHEIGAELGCDGMIYVMGRDESNVNAAFNYQYDPNAGIGGSWTIVTPCPATSPALAGRGMTRGRDGRIYLINGGEYNTSSDPRAWSYDPANDSWQQEPDSIRGYTQLAAATLGDRVYAIGGTVRIGTPEERRIESLGSIPATGSCAANPCLEEPTGACCLPWNGGYCVESTQFVCEQHLGTYMGDGQVCLGIEACCLPDEPSTCIEIDALCCELVMGGVPLGSGSVCDTDGDGNDDACGPPCDPPIISCAPDFFCPGGLGFLIEGGQPDDFCPLTEPVFVGPELAALNICGSPPKQFDVLTNDVPFCHTMTGLPSNIVAANLEIRLKAGSSSLSCNDTLSLQVAGSGFAWGRRIGAPGSGSCAGPLGLLASAWTPGSANTFCLDLANLPNADGSFTNILPLLNLTGRLDVRVQDDTGVDYMTLRLIDCACAAAPPDMVAWWPLDALEDLGVGAAGANDVRDIMLNGLHGDTIGTPVQLAGEIVVNSMCFDGVNNYVQVPNASALNFGTGDFSIDAWIKTSQTTGVGNIVDKRVEATSVTGYSMYVTGGNLAFQIADGAGTGGCASCPTTSSCTNYNSGVAVATGAWVHVAVTVSRGTNGGSFYVNGLPVSTFNPDCHPNSVTNTNPLRIGSRSSSVSGLFDGCIDEVELFSRELSDAEIYLIYAAGGAGKCKGACCLPDGSCLSITETECDALMGSYQGVGSVCLGDNNNNGVDDGCEPSGACCFPWGLCGVVTPYVCEIHLGTYLGDDTICEGDEACCLPDGSCVIIDKACCENDGGLPQGPGSMCLGDIDSNGTDDVCECHEVDNGTPVPDCEGPCPNADDDCTLGPAGCECGPGAATGACCLPDGTCTLLIQIECDAIGGAYQGDNVLCLGDEACCLPDGTCAVADKLCCENDLGGQALGPGSVCLGDLDGNGLDDACECGLVDDPALGPYCSGICPGPAPPIDECLPRCVNFDPLTGFITISDCDCREQNECGVDLLLSPPTCVGICDPGTVCKETQTILSDGTIDICCDCPPQATPLDCNGDDLVTLEDYQVAEFCLTGPTGGPVPAGCACADPDGDADVDMRDLRLFLMAITSP